jgi:PAS domain S-box-containing protein
VRPPTALMNEQQGLLEQNESLRRQLDEARRTIESLRAGEGDASARGGAAPGPVVTGGAAHDERRRAEQTAASIFRLSPIAMCLTSGLEGRYVDANESFLRLFGFERHELVGRTTLELGIWGDPLDRERMTEKLSASDLVTDFEGSARTKHGESRRVLLSTERVVIDGTDCFLSTILDITERKKADEALLASEKKYRQIVATAREGIWLIDESGLTTFVNPALEAMLGYEHDEMLGKSIFAFMDTADHPAEGARRSNRPHGNGPRLDVRYKRKDGTEVWALVVSTPLRDDAGVYQGALAMVTDITERKRAETRLEEYVSLLMATLEASADGILATDRSGNVTTYNQKLVQLFEAPIDVRTGPVERGLVFMAEQTTNPEAYLQRVRQIYALVDQESEDPLALADGRTFERRSQPQWIAGACVGRVWRFRDVTPERELQSRLLAADRLASMGALAAGVAHEINNPLAYVTANLGFLADELPELVSGLTEARAGEVAECLNDAREGAERVRRIVRDLKVFSRTDDVESGPVDLQRVLDFAVNMAGNEIRHRAKLVRDYGKIPLVRGNEGRFGQVFLNLIVNAAQSIREGNQERNEIRIVTRTDAGGSVRVEVHDTGSGIPAKLLKQIFVPFFTTKPIGTGTGLGLSICHSIIESMGGTIDVESEVGKGTVVRVVLRPATPETRLTPTPPAMARKAHVRGRVLVIDDDELVGGALRRLLGREHDVTLVTSGRAAFDHLASGAPVDVILCDLMMPEMTGMDVHEEMMRVAPHRAETMIFLSGGAFTARAREFLDRVPNERVEKPFDSAALRALVRKFLPD